MAKLADAIFLVKIKSFLKRILVRSGDYGESFLMTVDEVAKNLLEGKDCDRCPSFDNGSELCTLGGPRAIPDERTCELWGMWNMVWGDGKKIL